MTKMILFDRSRNYNENEQKKKEKGNLNIKCWKFGKVIKCFRFSRLQILFDESDISEMYFSGILHANAQLRNNQFEQVVFFEFTSD